MIFDVVVTIFLIVRCPSGTTVYTPQQRSAVEVRARYRILTGWCPAPKAQSENFKGGWWWLVGGVTPAVSASKHAIFSGEPKLRVRKGPNV